MKNTITKSTILEVVRERDGQKFYVGQIILSRNFLCFVTKITEEDGRIFLHGKHGRGGFGSLDIEKNEYELKVKDTLTLEESILVAKEVMGWEGKKSIEKTYELTGYSQDDVKWNRFIFDTLLKYS